jgi:SM-20-related protein
MAGPNVFRALGLMVVDDFLSESECAAYRLAAGQSAYEKATVRKTRLEEAVDESRRRVQVADVTRSLKSTVRSRLDELKPKLEQYYGVQLPTCESPQFLRYKSGDFYCPHSDGSSDEDAPDYLKQRRVSVVIFLNAASDQPCPGCYGGGQLTFYGLIRAAAFELCGLPLDPQRGLLVAFPSQTVHEVRPVTHGERHTVVTWFQEAKTQSPSEERLCIR